MSAEPLGYAAVRGSAVGGVILALAGAGVAAPEMPDESGMLRAGSRQVPWGAWFDRQRTRGFLRVAGWTSKIYRAWSVHVADLDGDGTDEVVLGVWSNVRRHAEADPHRSVWVLKYEGHRLTEAWRGSALARPLLDFTLLPGAGRRSDLIAAEQLGSRCVETRYRWNGFGFSGVKTQRVACKESYE